VSHQQHFNNVEINLDAKPKAEPETQYENVTAKVIKDFGGSVLLSLYNDSPALALKSVFPQIKWDQLTKQKELKIMVNLN